MLLGPFDGPCRFSNFRIKKKKTPVVVQGSLTDTFCSFEAWLFPPRVNEHHHLQGNVQVCNDLCCAVQAHSADVACQVGKGAVFHQFTTLGSGAFCAMLTKARFFRVQGPGFFLSAEAHKGMDVSSVYQLMLCFISRLPPANLKKGVYRLPKEIPLLKSKGVLSDFMLISTSALPCS